VNSFSTAMPWSATNSAQSAWPCVEKVQEPTSVICRRSRADVERHLAALAHIAGGTPGARCAHGRGARFRRARGIERLVRAFAGGQRADRLHGIVGARVNRRIGVNPRASASRSGETSSAIARLASPVMVVSEGVYHVR
jgi:hypothetical protein